MFRDSLRDMYRFYIIRHYVTKEVLCKLYYGLVYSKIQNGILVQSTTAMKYFERDPSTYIKKII